MSGYARVLTRLKDREALVAGLRTLDLPCEQFDKPEVLKNHWGAGHGVQRAEVIVRANVLKQKYLGQTSLSDIGFAYQADSKSYTLQVNDMDTRQFGDRWVEALQVQHDAALAKRLALRHGYRLTKTKTESNGEVELVFEVAGH